MYKSFIKRLLDIILSFLGLILLSWLYLIIIIAIKIDDPGSAFFSQDRIGIHKTIFKVHKFRSMKMRPLMTFQPISWRIPSSISRKSVGSSEKPACMNYLRYGIFLSVR